MTNYYDNCEHNWEEADDELHCNERQMPVQCTKCGVLGEQTRSTGEVYWPAT